MDPFLEAVQLHRRSLEIKRMARKQIDEDVRKRLEKAAAQTLADAAEAEALGHAQRLIEKVSK